MSCFVQEKSLRYINIILFMTLNGSELIEEKGYNTFELKFGKMSDMLNVRFCLEPNVPSYNNHRSLLANHGGSIFEMTKNSPQL